MNTAGRVWRRRFSPHGRICQVPVEQVRTRLIEVFGRWGKSGAMRVDNGLPFGVPAQEAPSVLALWLIAMDVDMIWNDPYCPQQNGRVEKMQDTTSRWAEVEDCRNLSELQQRLNWALCQQREHYPVERLAGRTRWEAFPELRTTRRPYAASEFNIQRVYEFLHPRLYTRKVSASGQIAHFGRLYSVGRSLRHQWVQLRLCKEGSHWEVLCDYKVVKTLPADNLSEAGIQNLTVFQRTSNKLHGAS